MKSGLIFKDQFAHALCLTVVEGPLGMDQFFVAGHPKTLEAADSKVTASIIGSSHVINYVICDARFSEVFACCNVQTDSKRAFAGPVGNVKGAVHLEFEGGAKYTFHMPKILTWAEGTRLADPIEEQALAEVDGMGLVFKFPKGDHSATPKTVILVKTLSTGIEVNTVHKYPNEGNIVLTKSTLRRT